MKAAFSRTERSGCFPHIVSKACKHALEDQEAEGIGSDFGGHPGSEVPRCQPKQLQRLWRHPDPPLHRLQTKRQVHAKPQEVSQALGQAGNRLQR